MASGTSTIEAGERQARGENANTWGEPRGNNALTCVAEAAAGRTTVSVGASDVTLDSTGFTPSIAGHYRYSLHVLTAGASVGSRNIIVPGVARVYRFKNLTGFDQVIKTSGGTGATVRSGQTSIIDCDGIACTVGDPTLDQIKTAAANVNVGGFKITNAADGSANSDLATVGQIAPYATAAAASASSASTSATTAQSWATSTSIVSGGFYGAYKYAQDAASSASAAASSASAAALFDPSSYYTKTAADARYLQLSGGTLTGTINFASLSETLNNLGSISGAQTITYTSGTVVAATITGTTTFTFSSPPTSGRVGTFTLELTNGGAFAITWPTSVKWPGGTAPTLTTSGVDVLVFYTRDGGTTWRGSVAQKDSR